MFQFNFKLFFCLSFFFFATSFILPQNTESKKITNPQENLYEENFQLLEKELDSLSNSSSVDNIESTEPTSWSWRIVKTFFTLFFLLGAFFLFLKFRSLKKEPTFTSSSIFHVLHEFMLSPGVFLKIIDFNSSLLILSVSNAGIQLLQEIKDKQSIDQIRLDCSMHKSPSNNKGQNQSIPDFWSSVISRLGPKAFSEFPNQKTLKNSFVPKTAVENSEKNLENLRKSAKENVSRMRNTRKDLHDVEK